MKIHLSIDEVEEGELCVLEAVIFEFFDFLQLLWIFFNGLNGFLVGFELLREGCKSSDRNGFDMSDCGRVDFVQFVHLG